MDFAKIKEIDNIGLLLEVLDSKPLFEGYSGFDGRFVKKKGGHIEFRVEFAGEKHVLEPRMVIQPSRRNLEMNPLADKELLLCPHISEKLAKDLRKKSISHADLNGRLFLRSPSALVDIRPGKIHYREPRNPVDPFSPKATRIIRHLLCSRNTALTQDDLIKATGASRALVSQVLTQLISEQWVQQESTSAPGRSAYYVLKDFDGLLDAWKEKDCWITRVTIYEYSVLANTPETIARKVVDGVDSKNVVFTQWFAAWLRRPYTTPPVVSCYVKSASILNRVPARPVESGGNLWLIVPADEGVWQDSQQVGDFQLVPDVQIYLDLLQVGLRGPEQAAELRQWEDFAI